MTEHHLSAQLGKLATNGTVANGFPTKENKSDNDLKKRYPKGFATLGKSAMLRRQVRRAMGKPRGHRSPRKIDVTGKLTVASVSVVTLIRTDTTLDHSQKAEKVWKHYLTRGSSRRGWLHGNPWTYAGIHNQICVPSGCG